MRVKSLAGRPVRWWVVWASSGLAPWAAGQCFRAPYVPGLAPQPAHRTVFVEERNGDGLPDLVVCSEANSPFRSFVSVGPLAYADASGPVLAGGEYVTIGDLDGDGIGDAASGNQRGTQMWCELGLPGGGFGPPFALPARVGLHWPAIADFTGDGHADIVAAAAGAAILIEGDGHGGFLPFRLLPGSVVVSSIPRTRAADLDGDGWMDVVIGCWNGNSVVGINDRAGGFAWQVLPESRATDFVLADLDADGKLEVILSARTLPRLEIYTQDAERVFTRTATPALPMIPLGVAAADLDGDGRMDVAVGGRTPAMVCLLRGAAGGGLEAPRAVASGLGQDSGNAGKSVICVDLDVDGDLDLVVADEALSVNPFAILENGAAHFASAPAGVDVRVGDPVVLSASLAGAPPSAGYRWTKDGVDLDDSAGVSGSGTTTLTLAAARTADAGAYRLRAMDGCGTVESSVATVGVFCPADVNRDGFTDFFDYGDYVESFKSGGGSADFNRDGFVDCFDYLGYVAAFETGCG